MTTPAGVEELDVLCDLADGVGAYVVVPVVFNQRFDTRHTMKVEGGGRTLQVGR